MTSSIKKAIYFVLILIIISSVGYLAYQKLTKKGPIKLPLIESKDERQEALNGSLVNPEDARRRPFAVMVENHPDSRPQAGLSKADRVYETLAEGGITRFMAIFQSQEVNEIGPVRSAREYYAEIANELNAIYVHVGGSDIVLANLSRGYYKNISDANQFYNGDYFRRITTRLSPHNVYTSTGELRKLAEDKNFIAEAKIDPWIYKDFIPNSGQLADEISINFSTKSYEVQYSYDKKVDQYLRNQSGKPAIDELTGEQIISRNVIVQYVKTAPKAGDEKARIDILTRGTGKSLVFRGGKVFSGTWKNTKESGTHFYDDTGNEIGLVRGTTWVELVPSDIERVNFKATLPVAPETN